MRSRNLQSACLPADEVAASAAAAAVAGQEAARAGAAPPPPDDVPAAQAPTLVHRLFAELARESIRHCHWKSNVRLAGAFDGREDVDLLVAPEQAAAFFAVIHRCGFKLAVSGVGAGHPGVFHALAWDPAVGRLIDLHGYFQLVSGDSFVKSFRFPVEREMLAHARPHAGGRVPEPAAELALFLVRVALKNVQPIEAWKVAKDEAANRAELDWLTARCPLAEAEPLFRRWFPKIAWSPAQLAARLIGAPLATRLVTGWRVAHALRGQRRLGPLASFGSRQLRVARHFWVRVRGRRHLTLLSGGCWIALAGPKASGKSTLTGLLADRLGRYLDVETVHLGRPPPTALTAVARLGLPLLRRLFPNERVRAYEAAERHRARRFSLLYVAAKWCIAIERRAYLRRMMRRAASGTLILSDRCPPSNASGFDGSAFDAQAVAQAEGRVKRWLMQRERAIYAALPAPRLVLRLEVPLDRALERDGVRGKAGGPLPTSVRQRFERERSARFDGSQVATIDTDRGLDETLREAMAAVWAVI